MVLIRIHLEHNPPLLQIIRALPALLSRIHLLMLRFHLFQYSGIHRVFGSHNEIECFWNISNTAGYQSYN